MENIINILYIINNENERKRENVNVENRLPAFFYDTILYGWSFNPAAYSGYPLCYFRK